MAAGVTPTMILPSTMEAICRATVLMQRDIYYRWLRLGQLQTRAAWPDHDTLVRLRGLLWPGYRAND